MKKLFISCPMKGRLEEDIKKSMRQLHRIAEAVFDEELEVIPSYIEDRNPENTNARIWYLGESIKLMAQADYYIGVYNEGKYDGCYIENHVARTYDIPMFCVDKDLVVTEHKDLYKAFGIENIKEK